MPLEKPSHEAEEPTHIGDEVAKARSSIGSYDEHVGHTDEVWDEESIEQRIDDRLSRHEELPVIEIYDFNADIMRSQALRIFAQAEQEGRELNDAEEREVIAAQLRLTLMESLSGALDAYMDVVEQYEEFKRLGMRADPAEEQLVFQHITMVKEAAQRRSDIVFKKHLKQLTPEQARTQALAADRDMLKLLAAEDKSVPGANPEGILPVYRLMISMLNASYNENLRAYENVADEGIDAVRERATKANELLREKFPLKGEGEITKEEANEAFSTIEEGYTLDQYLEDRLLLTQKGSEFDLLKKRGQANIERLARMNDAMGDYQIFRAELSSIRHHFDQAYDLDTKKKPIPGETSDAAMEATRSFLENQQQGSISALERHLELVDEGVLKVGIKEKAETLYNQKGRVFITRIADKIAVLETCWMPDLPFTSEGFARNSTREYLMSGLYDALGWPRDNNGTIKEWEDLSDQEKNEITQKQKSIEKCIDTFRDKKSLEKVQTSVKAVRILIDRKDLLAENFVSAGEIDEETLPTDIVTDTNIDELIDKYGAPVVYKMCFTQLQDNWDEYGKDYEELLIGFHEVIGVHYDFSRLMKSFADKQNEIAKWLAELSLMMWIAGIAAGAIGYEALRFLARKGAGRVLNTVKGGAGMAARAGRAGLRTTANVVRGTQNALRDAAAARAANKGATAAEKSVEAAGKASKLGRFLGRLGVILAGAELRNVMMRDARLMKPGEMEGVNAGIELMELHGNKGSTGVESADAITRHLYDRDLEYLYNQQEALLVEDGVVKVNQEIVRAYSPELKNKKAKALVERGQQLEQAAQKHAKEFHNLFPITDYFVKDPKGAPGNIGFDVRNIDEARFRGVDYARSRTPLDFSLLNPQPASTKEKITDEQLGDLAEEFKDAGSIEAYAEKQLLQKAQAIDDLSYFPYFQEAYQQYLEDAADLLEE